MSGLLRRIGGLLFRAITHPVVQEHLRQAANHASRELLKEAIRNAAFHADRRGESYRHNA
jgi:hypothetical protein